MTVSPRTSRRRAYDLVLILMVILLGCLSVGLGVLALLDQSEVPATPVAAVAKNAPSVPLTPVPAPTGPACPTVDPCHITIGAIGVDTSVAARPTVMMWDPFVQQTVSSFGVPDDFTTTAWWSSGPRPGAQGMAVILGHHHSTGYGVFNQLDQLTKGSTVQVRAGSLVLDYRVDTVDAYLPKTDASALSDALSAHSGTEDLALISCIGPADSASHQIAANMIVFAKLVGSAHVVRG